MESTIDMADGVDLMADESQMDPFNVQPNDGLDDEEREHL